MRNLTPHALVLRLSTGEDVNLPPDAMGPARVVSTSEVLDRCCDVPIVTSPVWGDVTGLPEPSACAFCEGSGVAACGTACDDCLTTGLVPLLVSSIVLGQCQGRRDVYGPDTSPAGAVRDEKGQIVAVRRLVAAPGVTS